MVSFLILGHKGWIGQQVMDILEKGGYTTYTTGVRADNESGIKAVLDNVKPTHVISLIGRTHGPVGSGFTTIDYLEQEGKLVDNVRDNLFAPLLLSRLCEERGIHFTYMGTGCIFKYDDAHPSEKEVGGFKEEDVPNFFGSSYSIVKGFTDRLLKEKCLNIRIRMPITACDSGRNFINKITTYEKICSIKNSMTVLPELLPIMIDLAVRGKVGTYNMTNPGLISHNEILRMYKDIVDPAFEWKNFSLEEQRSILAADRSNNYLDTSKLEREYPSVTHIKDAVKRILHQMKKSKSSE